MTGKKKTVLIVDDEMSLVRALKEKLTHEGFKTLEAIDGKDGLESALREKPDLILLDILMPVMDGLRMLEKLREDEWGKDVKVIMLTNLSDSEKIAESLKYGSYEYLVKANWNLEDVVKKVRERLGK